MTADSLDPVIHAPARLRIVATLAALPDGASLSFTRLQDMLEPDPRQPDHPPAQARGRRLPHQRDDRQRQSITHLDRAHPPGPRRARHLHRTRSATCSAGCSAIPDQARRSGSRYQRRYRARSDHAPARLRIAHAFVNSARRARGAARWAVRGARPARLTASASFVRRVMIRRSHWAADPMTFTVNSPLGLEASTSMSSGIGTGPSACPPVCCARQGRRDRARRG